MKAMEMTGYREPTQMEKDAIAKLVSRDLKPVRIANTIYIVFLSIVSMSGLLTILMDLLENNRSDMKLNAVVTICSLCILILLILHSLFNRKALAAVREGEFLIMDCQAYEASLEYGSKHPNTGAIRIYNESVQYCDEWWFVDAASCRDSMRKQQVNYYLVHCGDQKKGYYKVFSERAVSETMV